MINLGGYNMKQLEMFTSEENKSWHILKREMLNEYNHQCAKCKNGKEYRLEVHHILGRRSPEGDNKDFLIPLCNGCHLEWHMLENQFNIPFVEWLELPKANEILTAIYLTKKRMPDMLGKITIGEFIDLVPKANIQLKEIEKKYKEDKKVNSGKPG